MSAAEKASARAHAALDAHLNGCALSSFSGWQACPTCTRLTLAVEKFLPRLDDDGPCAEFGPGAVVLGGAR